MSVPIFMQTNVISTYFAFIFLLFGGIKKNIIYYVYKRLQTDNGHEIRGETYFSTGILKDECVIKITIIN